MAYCSKCGAYIPDGMTRCLACGYDENAAQTAAQYAYKYDEEQAKKDYEAERARKQEESKQWAREEYARRKQQQEEDEARRRAEAEAEESYDSTRTSEAGLSYTQGNSRFFAALSYVPFLFLLQKMFLPDDKFAEYHGKQGRKLTFVWMFAQIIASILPIPGTGLVVFALGCGFVARGIANAKAGKMVDLPFISKLFNRFKK